ncbi:MAG: AraC family transcriptional regulator [Spirochaetota bacterium]
MSTMRNIINVTGRSVSENFGKYRLNISNAYSYTLNINPSNRLHMHDEYEFNLVLSGTGKYFHDKETTSLQRGDVFCSDSQIIHEISSKETRDLCILWFNVIIESTNIDVSDTYEDNLIHAFLNGHSFFVPKQYHLFHYIPLLSPITEKNAHREYGAAQATRNMLLEEMQLLTNTSIKLNTTKTSSKTFLGVALDYINRNLTRRITLPELTAITSTSERNLRYLFQKYLGKSIIDEINGRKMKYASHLLRMRLNVQEVSEYLGILDPSQFSRLFKKYYDISPKKYQLLCSPADARAKQRF